MVVRTFTVYQSDGIKVNIISRNKKESFEADIHIGKKPLAPVG